MVYSTGWRRAIPLESARHRLDVFSGHLATALRELHITEQAGALSGVLAECCRAYLGPMERAFLAGGAVQACDAGFQADLIRALEYDQAARKLRQEDRAAYELERQECAEHWAKRLKTADGLIPKYGQVEWLNDELARCRSYCRLYQ